MIPRYPVFDVPREEFRVEDKDCVATSDIGVVVAAFQDMNTVLKHVTFALIVFKIKRNKFLLMTINVYISYSLHIATKSVYLLCRKF